MKAEQLRKSILQLAIQGKLVKQDPNDEPASVLLERIRAEKQRLIKEGKIKKDKGDSIIFKGDDNCHYEKIGSEVKNIDDEIPFEIPDTWCWCRIKDCYDIRNGFTPLRSESKFWSNGTVPWFTVEDIRNQGKVIYSTQQHITEEAITADRIVPANSFLLCCTASVGVYAQTKIPLTTNQQFNALTVKNSHKSLLIDEYLFGIGEYFSSLLHSAAGKTTFEFVSVKKLGAFIIPVPPKKEQERIIDALQEFDPMLKEYDKLEQQATKLDTEIYDKLKKSILQYAIQGKLVEQDETDEPASALLERIRAEKNAQLGKKYVESYIYKGDDNCYYEKVGKNEPVLVEDLPFDIPDTWSWTRLKDIVYNHGQKTPTIDFSYIDIGSIDNKRQKLSSVENIITADKAPSRARKIIKFGDILYSTVRPYLHNMCIVDKDFRCEPIASTGFAVLSCEKGIYNQFLFYYMLSPIFDLYANSTENAKGVAYPAINDDRLYKAIIPIPPQSKQERICLRIKEVLKHIEKDES